MKRPGLINLALAAAIVATGVGTYLAVGARASAKSNPSTVDVSAGTVLASVSASGTVVPSQQVGLNFLSSGVVLEVDVKVGDRVSAGQVLAKIDPTNAQNSLTEAQAQLAAAQDNLATLQTASTSTSTTVTTAASNNPGSSAAASQADQQLSMAQANLQRDSAKLQGSQGQLSAAQAAFQQATAKVSHDLAFQQQCLANPATPPSGNLTCATVADQLAIDTASQASAQAAVVAAGVSVTAAQQAVTADQTAVAAAAAAVSVTKASGSTSASSGSGTSNASASSGGNGAAGNSGGGSSVSIAQAEATVTTDQITVDNAQKALDATTMVAPSDGTVSSLTGAVGQTVSAGSSGSTSSTGSTGSGGSGSSGSSAAGGTSSSTGSSSSSSAGSSSSAFLTLTNLNSLQVEAGFTEADATKLVVGQKAITTFSALPNEQVQGEVAQIAITATTSNGVVSYATLIDLDQVPAGLKPGMTATAQVVVGEADNAVLVPASAVTGTGTTGTVTVIAGDGTETVTPVTVGLRGDTTVEITSGVKAGDKVLRSTIVASAPTTGGTGRVGATTGGLTGTGGIGGAGPGAGAGTGRVGGGPTG